MKEPGAPCPFLCGAKGGELHGWLEIIGKCNLECTYCYTDSKLEVEEELSTEEVKTIIDALKELKALTLTFSGGEPCLKQDLPELIEYASQHIETKLVTNGTVLTNQIIDALTASKTQVQLSIDSVNPRSYEKSRGRPFLSRVLKNIDNLLENDIELVLAVTLTEHTMDSVFDVLHFAIEKGIANVHMGSLIPEGRGKADRLLSGCFLKKLYEFQKENFEVISIDIIEDLLFPIILEEKKDVYCNAMMGKTLEIGFDGTVYICGGMRELKSMNLGNIRKDPLESIYERAIRENKMVYLPVDKLETCKECQYKYICAGGCRARAYHYSKGNLLAEEPNCKFLKNIIRVMLEDYKKGELDAYATLLRFFLEETGIRRKKIF